MFVLSLMLTGIFAIVGGTTQLASEMETGHERDALIHSLAQFCERTLRGLPGMAEVRLRVKESGRLYLSELAMKNTPSPIGGGGNNGLTILRTEQTLDGYMRVVLESLSEEEASAAEHDRGGVPSSRLVLLENISRFDWKFFNPRSNEWETVWNEKLSLAPAIVNDADQPPPAGEGQPAAAPAAPGAAPAPAPPAVPAKILAPRPGMIELTIAVGADAPRSFVFWVPNAKVPGQQQPGNPVTPPVVTPPTGPTATPRPNTPNVPRVPVIPKPPVLRKGK